MWKTFVGVFSSASPVLVDFGFANFRRLEFQTAETVIPNSPEHAEQETYQVRSIADLWIKSFGRREQQQRNTKRSQSPPRNRNFRVDQKVEREPCSSHPRHHSAGSHQANIGRIGVERKRVGHSTHDQGHERKHKSSE